jgi:leucine dehydrogenase
MFLIRKEQPMVQSLHATGLVEDLVMIDDRDRGAIGVIAVHSTALGPAAGGCRFWEYASREDIATDAIRLARGMSFKNALAGLPFGGGKAVMCRPSGSFDRKALFEAVGDAVAQLGGRYVTAEDVGTTVADMSIVASRTRHVAGLALRPGRPGGDPSPWTALGVFKAMQRASRFALGTDLKGLTVAVQGVGNVGERLCSQLHRAGARLVVADANERRAREVAHAYGARLVTVDQILGVEADILAPCALGAVLNRETIPTLRARLVCGGANNQLATDEDGVLLLERGIAYAPDYVVNAGGIINVAAEYLDESMSDVQRRIDLIPDRIEDILTLARQECRPSHKVADAMAQDVIGAAHRRAA